MSHGQTLVPELQLLISTINSADGAMLMTIDPRLPNLCQQQEHLSVALVALAGLHLRLGLLSAIHPERLPDVVGLLERLSASCLLCRRFLCHGGLQNANACNSSAGRLTRTAKAPDQRPGITQPRHQENNRARAVTSSPEPRLNAAERLPPLAAIQYAGRSRRAAVAPLDHVPKRFHFSSTVSVMLEAARDIHMQAARSRMA
jgi:hypothetical protein